MPKKRSSGVIGKRNYLLSTDMKYQFNKIFPLLIKSVANSLVPVTADMNIKVPVNLKQQPRRHNGTLTFTSIHLLYLMIHFYAEN